MTDFNADIWRRYTPGRPKVSSPEEVARQILVARELLGRMFPDYGEKVAPYRKMLREAHEKTKAEQTMLELASAWAGELDAAGKSPLWLLAASVDEALS